MCGVCMCVCECVVWCVQVAFQRLFLHSLCINFWYFASSEFEKSNSIKKQQRKGTPGRLKRLCSPTSLFKPPLTERQQLALLMQMSDASRHAG